MPVTGRTLDTARVAESKEPRNSVPNFSRIYTLNRPQKGETKEPTPHRNHNIFQV